MELLCVPGLLAGRAAAGDDAGTSRVEPGDEKIVRGAQGDNRPARITRSFFALSTPFSSNCNFEGGLPLFRDSPHVFRPLGLLEQGLSAVGAVPCRASDSVRHPLNHSHRFAGIRWLAFRAPRGITRGSSVGTGDALCDVGGEPELPLTGPPAAVPLSRAHTGRARRTGSDGSPEPVRITLVADVSLFSPARLKRGHPSSSPLI